MVTNSTIKVLHHFSIFVRRQIIPIQLNRERNSNGQRIPFVWRKRSNKQQQTSLKKNPLYLAISSLNIRSSNQIHYPKYFVFKPD